SGAGVEFYVHESFCSVIAAIHEPVATGEVAIHAVERGAGFCPQRDVPLVALPAIVRPPFPGGAPGPGAGGDFGARVLEERDARRPVALHLDARAQRRTEQTQRDARAARVPGFQFSVSSISFGKLETRN